jgi:cobalt-zinc-cadmium efflux system protein
MVRIVTMHAHSHGADHGSHAHSHSHDHLHGALNSSRMTNVLGISVLVTLMLVAVEFTAGYFGHSIALVSDAVHNLTDVPSIFISWLALRLAQRPPTREHTYGYHRAGILAAFTNAFFLSIVATGILYEAITRLRHPAGVNAGLMLWVALIALVVNGGITLALVSGRRDLNVRSILVHSFGDALSNVAIIAGALAIRWLGIAWIDPLIAAVIGAMVLWSGWGILRETSHILLEGLPREMRLEDVARSILSVPNVLEVHDIHVWTLGTDLNALSCHIQIPDMHLEEMQKILSEIKSKLEADFKITHTTIQFERAGLPAHSGYHMPLPVQSPKE